MATLTKPPSPGWRSVTPLYRRAKAVVESPFTYQKQVHLHPGEQWKFSLELPPIKDATVAQSWIAFLHSLAKNDDTFSLAVAGYVPSSISSPMTVRLADSGNEATWTVGNARVFGLSFTVEQVVATS